MSGRLADLSRALHLARLVVVVVAVGSLLSPLPCVRYSYRLWDDEARLAHVHEYRGIDLVWDRDFVVWVTLAACLAALPVLVAERRLGPLRRGFMALATTIVVMPVAGLLMSRLESVVHLQFVGLLDEEQLLMGAWLVVGAAVAFILLTVLSAVAAFVEARCRRQLSTAGIHQRTRSMT